MSSAPDTQHPRTGLDLKPFAFTRRSWVDATPDAVCRLVSDVSRIETWSPGASGVRYAPGDGPRAGARFSGRNRRDGREWVIQSEVVHEQPLSRRHMTGRLLTEPEAQQAGGRWRRISPPGS